MFVACRVQLVCGERLIVIFAILFYWCMLQNTLRAATSRLGRPVYKVAALTEKDFPASETGNKCQIFASFLKCCWVEYRLFLAYDQFKLVLPKTTI